MVEKEKQKIIAIDPGYDRCGVAIVSEVSGKSEVVFSTCITSDKNDEQYLRLTSIFKQLEEIIEKYKPSNLAIETLFFSVNKKTAIKVAEARGAILALAGLQNLGLVELSPQAIKIALTGSGNATKEQVKKMVNLTVSVSKKGVLDDEIDAIAVGVTALQEIKFENLKNGLAK
ncbi:MAG: crossover junction endodeoxyribonuclease RuvC [Candidatus Pacebacteria bacterium]|nr:crossover junction endodeoxyribonuclease RuvC [Candidatus Paceibacterota bacterium]